MLKREFNVPFVGFCYPPPPFFCPSCSLFPSKKNKKFSRLCFSLSHGLLALATFAASQFLKPLRLLVAKREKKALKARRRSPDKVAHLPFEWDVKNGHASASWRTKGRTHRRSVKDNVAVHHNEVPFYCNTRGILWVEKLKLISFPFKGYSIRERRR